MKIVEKPGMRVTAMVQDMSNFMRLSCGRQNCPLVRSGSDCYDECYCEGVVYIGECKLCISSKSMYIGESSRTLYTRANQHLNDFKK